ncbi:MAG: radical SAM protein [Syntrophobacteraceae bacterium]|nr:radical SAM protein [Syntrophobacteraceae bacterium]
MKLLIVQPSHFLGRSNRKLYRARRKNLVGLTLPYLASLTPPQWDVKLIDQRICDIDFESPVDLVAITVWTENSLPAYEIADGFRARGVKVIMGGPHTFFFSAEAAQHCDAVGIGEGETLWKPMLDDAANGSLKQFYRAKGPHDLKNLPFPRYDLLDFRKYSRFKTFAIQTSRGCPFRCDFCSERFFLGNDYRFRPVSDVIEEILASKGKYFLFADSTFAGKKDHSMKLMEALIPLGLRWSALWSMNLCLDRQFMDLARRSGLLHLNIGMESIDQATLSGMNKRANKVRQYGEIVKNLCDSGVSYSLNFVFGYDCEPPSIFDSTLDFLRQNRVPVAYFNVLTPHIGTPFYERMVGEGRLLDTENIGRWPEIACYFKPKNCAPQELEENVKAMYRKFYNLRSMFSRLPFPTSQSDIASWVVNFSQRKTACGKTARENFDDY